MLPLAGTGAGAATKLGPGSCRVVMSDWDLPTR